MKKIEEGQDNIIVGFTIASEKLKRWDFRCWILPGKSSKKQVA